MKTIHLTGLAIAILATWTHTLNESRLDHQNAEAYTDPEFCKPPIPKIIIPPIPHQDPVPNITARKLAQNDPFHFIHPRS